MPHIDKFVLKFLADVLYIKQVICFEELEAIMEVTSFEDLDVIVDKMLRSEYNLYRRGESYEAYVR